MNKQQDKSSQQENTMGFQGFVPPVDNYFRVPNEWINICAQINSLAELKVIQYVLRHTWGFNEYDQPKKITIDEFMLGRKKRDQTRIDNGTGLSEPSVKDGIKRAINDGYLLCEVDDSDRGRIKKYYMLRLAPGVTSENIQAFLKEARLIELQTMPYQLYLQTLEWQEQRKKTLKRAAYRCQVCNTKNVPLNVHHRTYERRGNEQDQDLIVLCQNCHEIFHTNGNIAGEDEKPEKILSKTGKAEGEMR